MKNYILLIILFWTCVTITISSCSKGKEDSGTIGYINLECKRAKQVFLQECSKHQPSIQCRNNWEDIRADAFNCALPPTLLEKE